MKNLKFKVHSPKHSEAIQKRLFELGADWSITENKITQYKNDPFLYLEDKIILRGSSNDFFHEDKSLNTTLDDLYNPEFIEEDNLKTKMEAKIKELQEPLTNYK